MRSKTLIRKLFSEGQSFTIPPFRVIWLATQLPENVPAQTAIAVSKKLFKKATERNTIKRRIREAYRKQKHQLYNTLLQQDKQIALMLIYTNPEIPKYEEIAGKISLILNRLEKDIQNPG